MKLSVVSREVPGVGEVFLSESKCTKDRLLQINVPGDRINSIPSIDEICYKLYQGSGYEYFEELKNFIFFSINKELSIKDGYAWLEDIAAGLFKPLLGARLNIFPAEDIIEDNLFAEDKQWYRVCYNGEPVVLATLGETKGTINISFVLPNTEYMHGDKTRVRSNDDITEFLTNFCNNTIFYK